jgi:hypothetical protein
VLHTLLCHHPNWPKLKKILEEGSKWPLAPIPSSVKKTKNVELIIRGNHKSANKYRAELKETLEKEVSQGWMIPLPLEYISYLRNGELAPVGMDNKQCSVLPDGSMIPKLRLTHDQSFNTSQGKSVNDRVLTVRILGGKSDIKAAYRRVSLHGHTAESCTIMFEDLGLTSLRLTFGGSPCPNVFCLSSELCMDLANDLLHCKEWDPLELKSPHADKIGKPCYLDPDIPCSAARELDVDVPDDDNGRVDDFIDDRIVIVPDLLDNTDRALQAMPLAIHILFRPIDPNEKIKRDDCLSLGKLQEEGFLT